MSYGLSAFAHLSSRWLVSTVAVLTVTGAALAAGHANITGGETSSPKLDPATVMVPDLTFVPTTSDRNHYWEYFYFHKAGVSFEKAADDWTECLSYSANLDPGAPQPDFVPINASMPIERNTGSYTFEHFGLVGLAIAAIVNEELSHETERINTRLCMGYKGYGRYGLPKSTWKKVTAGTPEEVGIRFAKMASGPAPQSEALVP